MKNGFLIGILYLIFLSFIAIVVNYYTNNFIGEVVIALVIGIVSANVFSIPKSWEKSITFGEKKVLGWAIGLMGLQLSFMELQNLAWLLPFIIMMIFVSLFLGEKIAARFGVKDKCGILLGAGNAICGSAAIAAVSPIIKSEAHDTGVSISVIQILGTVGMLAIPAIANIYEANDLFWGVLSGGTLQAVGQAIAGGFAVSESAGETATIIKMIRVLMLLPVVLYFSFRFSEKSEKTKRPKFPSFIIAFVLLMIVANVFSLPEDVLVYAKESQNYLLTFAMVSIGNKIHYKDLIVKGVKALKMGSVIFLFQIIFIVIILLANNYFFGKA